MTAAELRFFALSLPESVEEPHFHLTSFRVRGKIFATLPPGEEVANIFLKDEERELALAMNPEFLEKLTWGAKSVGVRVRLADADVVVVEELLRMAGADPVGTWSPGCSPPRTTGWGS